MLAEDRLIRYCAWIDINDNITQKIKEILSPDLNWAYFFERAKSEGVLSLVFESLSKIDNTQLTVPADIWERLTNCYYASAGRNVLLCQKLNTILTAFNQAGIKVILLKGMALIHTIYPNIALRPMSDMDILIRKEDLINANEVLNSLGYLYPRNYEDFVDNLHLSSINTLNYMGKNSSNFFVHLHWHLINATWPLDFLVRKIDMDKIWTCAAPVKVCDIDTLTLSPEHLLIYLAQHGFLHHFDKLIRLSDIARILKHYKDTLNWDFVIEEARRFNLSYILYHSLRFTSNVFQFEIPQLESLKSDKATFSEKISSFFICKGIRSYKLSYLAYLSMHIGLLSKLRFLVRTVFPPPIVLAHNLDLPISEIRTIDYYKRFINNFFRLLP